jgi:dCMP deaminase
MNEKWDLRFLELTKLVSTWSKDPSTKTGAVIVDSKRNIVSTGYNGFPHRLLDTPQRYNDRPTKYSMIVHCEMNAVLNSDRSVEGCTLYTWPFLSCDRCAVHMIQAGITRAVAPVLPIRLYDRWLESVTKTKTYFREAGIEVVEVDIEIEECQSKLDQPSRVSRMWNSFMRPIRIS